MNRPMSSLHKSTQSVVDHWEEDKSKAAGFLRRCKVPVHCLRNEEHHDNDLAQDTLPSSNWLLKPANPEAFGKVPSFQTRAVTLTKCLHKQRRGMCFIEICLGDLCYDQASTAQRIKDIQR
jgi:hypothetical protein